jgi:hypothetical protein
MAFTPVDIPIQEMLQSDFIVDLAQIHNSNVLLLKDKVEDLINTFEMDINTVSIGVDNPINNLKTQNVVLQDGGFILQTGIPNQIIAKLSINGSSESVLNVDNLTIDLTLDSNDSTTNTLTVNDSLSVVGNSEFTGMSKFNGSMVESKETLTALLEFDGVDSAEARISLTDTSKRNIYVKLSAETNIGATQVWDGAAFTAGLANIKLYLDLDLNSPMEQNTSFTIYIVDVIENSGNTSLASQVNVDSIPVTVNSGVNLSAGSASILLHNDLDGLGFKLGINPSSTDILNSALSKYGANATFNYILDEDTNDRFLITSTLGMEVFS